MLGLGQGTVLAHGVGTRADLPIPVNLAIIGGGAAVLISFVALGALWPESRLRGNAAGRALPAGVQAVALGLEGLGARLAEVLALGSTAGDVDPSAAQIDELTLELEGLRAGLVETEALSRKALEAAPPETA